MSSLYNKKIGQWGEQLTVRFLASKGWLLMEENWRRRGGEIDLIFSYKDQIIFVEVKTRTSCCFGFPEDSINERKKQHLKQTMEKYLFEKQISLEPRFDVMVVEIVGLRPKFTHYENISF